MPSELVSGKGGLPMVHVANDAATADIMLLGAHLISFIPAKGTQLIWLSKNTRFENGVPIRGGIPICWPWFGKNTDNPELPMHGIARTSVWSLTDQKDLDSRTTQVTLTLEDTPETHRLWDFKFNLKAVFTVADTLSVELITTNQDDKPFPISQGIHTYFQVDDIQNIEISGFDHTTFFNKVDGTADNDMPAGPFKVNQEVDRVFNGAPGPFTILDKQRKRTITVTNQGSNSAVIWNPWKERSAVLPDYAPDAYLTMVCVETCNALADAKTVNPGASLAIKATYSIA